MSDVYYCSNCLTLAGSDLGLLESCIDCISSNPHGLSSDGNWACGQCLSISDAATRAS